MSDQPTRPTASRRVASVPGSEAALSALRDDIARLEAELQELEQRTAEVERGDVPQPAELVGPMSARMADELGTNSVEQERADMTRFLDGTLAVCDARVAEARSTARAVLDAARDDLACAVRERAALVEEVIASPPTPPDADAPDRSVGVAAEAADAPVFEVTVPSERVDPGEVAPPDAKDTLAPTGRLRATVISVLLWIVGGALVVVGLAFAIVVVLMLLD